MTVQQIITGDCPPLRQTATAVETVQSDVSRLLQDLVDTLTDSSVLYLTAPQLGQPVRALALYVDGQITCCLNPEVVSVEGEQSETEVCASFPHVMLRVSRPARLYARWLTADGHVQERWLTGQTARVFAHALDHLEGVLFLDRVEELELIQQLWEQWGGEGVAGEACVMAPSPDDTTDSQHRAPAGQPAEEALRREWQQAVDLLADAAWKWTLACTWLQELADHPQLDKRLERMLAMGHRLQTEVEAWLDTFERKWGGGP
ncbi:MAG: peptide deformylase [Alicyclobacillus sp.]|nr:peptide deformylase [Alicyclobacillus sp.]